MPLHIYTRKIPNKCTEKKAVKIRIFQLRNGLFRLKMKALMLNSLSIVEEPWRGKLPAHPNFPTIGHLNPNTKNTAD